MRSTEWLRQHVLNTVAPLRETSVILCKTDVRTGTYLGGHAPACPGLRWPAKDGRPLAFVACIDLSTFDTFDWLPTTGLLLFFFYDVENVPYGGADQRGAWAVRYVADGSGKTWPAAGPPGGISQVAPMQHLEPQRRELPPPWELTPLSEYDKDLDEEEMEASCHLLDAMLDEEYSGPQHHIGGYAQAHQGADLMELNCQLHSTGHRSFAYGELSESEKAAAVDWRLLLQLDNDPDLDLELTGDSGRLFYWVRAQDARQGDFRGAWITTSR